MRRWIASFLLIGFVLAIGAALAAWKHNTNLDAVAASAHQPEPVEVVTIATAQRREYLPSTTAIGTALATRSITLKNELSGTVRRVTLAPGRIVEAGTLLVALDVSVEEAELHALEAQARLAETSRARLVRLLEQGAAAQQAMEEIEAQCDVTKAQIARVHAIIAKKTIRAPFRARVGLADLHEGQYLEQGVSLTTLQGISEQTYVDFAVVESVAAGIRVGGSVQVSPGSGGPSMAARVIAVDARVDQATRSATVRARVDAGAHALLPGASVRVFVPVGESSAAVAIPASALRKSPAGNYVWVIAAESGGAMRAHRRAIESGPVVGEMVLVLAGLSEGEQVAAAGSFKLREAARVQPGAALASAVAK